MIKSLRKATVDCEQVNYTAQLKFKVHR